MKKYYIVLFVLIILSCDTPPADEKNEENSYAKNFKIDDKGDYSVISVLNPWQGAENIKIQYVLSGNRESIPDSLASLPFIKTPVNDVIVFSTTHIGFLSALGESHGVTGVSGLDYTCDKVIRSNAELEKVYEVGNPPNVDYERIINMKPDLVFLYGLQSSVTGISSRLRKSGIPSILIAEYLEPHPLGKMEWIRLFGELYDKAELSENIFRKTVLNYQNAKRITDTLKEKPWVLVGLPWKDTWYMSGGKSFTARLIEDAGGNYVLNDNTSSEYIPLSLEAAISRSFDADIWINTGSARSINEILGRDERFSLLDVYRQRELYNNDAKLCGNGGNAFWEKGVVEPDIILKDMIKIFHPELMKAHDFVYYRKLE